MVAPGSFFEAGFLDVKLPGAKRAGLGPRVGGILRGGEGPYLGPRGSVELERATVPSVSLLSAHAVSRPWSEQPSPRSDRAAESYARPGRFS
ncbi:hypothetical protein AAFF_G00270360 [Aldrovandia affinis]|uniref:Uncharacterized protein n=1 Tax=Aldrovandia affinis TaxID=143900 RepID=A0AAD7W2G0_9TELE|nr:hypothetical protein AAFF_G00270360 [Aldrovandia affinis]